MKACGLIVEYNPFHNGHQFHVNTAKELSQADCMIAVMSGPFLQRGEPAIIDKFHRTKAALASGVDIVLELPYRYAVQSSKRFAKGAVMTLNEIGVSSICFGSESGEIQDFYDGYRILKENKSLFNKTIQFYLNEGLSFPKASDLSYKEIGFTDIDMFKPNNILGFSYVRTILDNDLAIDPLTMKRTNNDFHEKTITHRIASATSVREELVTEGLTEKVSRTIPEKTIEQLKKYKEKTSLWHTWESYFPFLLYRVMTMKPQQLQKIKGVDEGLEHRIKSTAEEATSFEDWMNRIKTKRYTWTRLQRMFTHLLTNTLKDDYPDEENDSVSYIRLLGMTETGRNYLNQFKKDLNIPLITSLTRETQLDLDEKASLAYYSVLSPEKRKMMYRQEITRPIIYRATKEIS